MDRCGPPLPGITPSHIVSQLVYRSLWPRLTRADAVLDWLGLRGAAARSTGAVAAGYGVTASTLLAWMDSVRAVGARVPLSAGMIEELTRRTCQGEDGLSRRRVADVLGLAVAAPVRRPVSTADRRAVRMMTAVLAATGPQPTWVLWEALSRTRRYSPLGIPAEAMIVELLQQVGVAALDGAGRWVLTAPRPAHPEHLALMRTAGGAVHSRAQMAQILIGLGRTSISAHGRSLDGHLLIRRVARDRYQVIQPCPPGGSAAAAAGVAGLPPAQAPVLPAVDDG